MGRERGGHLQRIWLRRNRRVLGGHVPSGKYTDFRRALAAKDGERIVFSWQVWPDKATLEAAEAKMHKDNRLEVSGEIPFDARRLILGCFKPVYTMGR
jgi:uncharacterized protein YbaA (DUF1428 family)